MQELFRTHSKPKEKALKLPWNHCILVFMCYHGKIYGPVAITLKIVILSCLGLIWRYNVKLLMWNNVIMYNLWWIVWTCCLKHDRKYVVFVKVINKVLDKAHMILCEWLCYDSSYMMIYDEVLYWCVKVNILYS